MILLADGILDDEWDNYLSKTYELASYMLKLIQSYSNRLNGFLMKKINRPNPELTYSNSISDIEDQSSSSVKRVSINTEDIQRKPSKGNYYFCIFCATKDICHTFLNNYF